jgi:hypothetical protein
MADGKLLVAGRAMRCKPRHVGPFSIGLHRTGQFRCENCDAVLSGVEVYIDATEHAAHGKQAQATLQFAATSLDAMTQAGAVSTLEPLRLMS